LGRVHFAIANAYRALGRDDEARPHFESALTADPSQGEIWTLLGWLHVEARAYDEAARWFRDGLAAKRASRWWPVPGGAPARALEDLRRFCLDSTIWNDVSHNYRQGGTRRSYLGTYAHDGFCCPLLFQIAEELTRALPAIFKDHRLRQMWAYKYETDLEGID